MVILLTCCRPACAAPRGDVAWVALGDARVVSWGEGGKVTPLRSVDLQSAVELSPGELLLVPVDPGDVLRGVGALALGLGSGSEDMPDAITWWPAGSGQIRVPSWSSARFLAVRVTSRASSRVELYVARAVSDPFMWYRLDEAISSWLFDGRPLAVAPPSEGAAAL